MSLLDQQEARRQQLLETVKHIEEQRCISVSFLNRKLIFILKKRILISTV